MNKIPESEQTEQTELSEGRHTTFLKCFFCDFCNLIILLLFILSIMGTIYLRSIIHENQLIQTETTEMKNKMQLLLDISSKAEKQDMNQFIKSIQVYHQEKLQAELQRRINKMPVKLPEIETNYSKLIGMGRPRSIPRVMMLVTISNPSNPIDSICPVFNAINMVSKTSVEMVVDLLRAGIKKVIMIVDAKEYLLSKHLKEQLSYYDVSQKYVAVDSNYKFIRDEVKPCSKVIFLQNTFILSGLNIKTIIRQTDNLPELTMLYTSSIGVEKNGNTTIKALKNLNETDLESVLGNQISEYLFAFDSRFLDFITPINFAYFNKYTVEEMFIYPILAVLQGSERLTQLTESVHRLKENFMQFVEFQLIQLIDSNSNICFLSFPNDPYTAPSSDLSDYLSPLKNSGDKSGLYLIIYAAYNFKSSTSKQSLWKIFKQIAEFKEFDNIRLRIRANKTVVSLGTYESAHTYCPSHSLMVSSRQNVRFSSSFVETLRKDLNEKDNYYFYRFVDQSGNSKELPDDATFAKRFRSQALYFQTHLTHLQIFKSDLFRMLHLWALKSDEIDFYQTEASFLFPLMETIDFKFTSKQNSMFTVHSRKISSEELQQIQSLQLCPAFAPATIITPCFYNSLSNICFRRFAANWIQKNIHQLWLGNNVISPLRQALAQTFKLKNPQYQYILWTAANITIENFPYTYSTVMRILNYEKRSNASNLIAVSNLLRYEILYQHGGIYADTNIECKKSLDPFLKYEIFFSEPSYWFPGGYHMKSFGNSFMGASRFSYYLNILLSMFVSDVRIQENDPEFVEKTNGFILRRVFNDEETFVVPGFGMQLFRRSGLCESQSSFTAGQKVFESEQQKMKIGIPCPFHEESFIYEYKIN